MKPSDNPARRVEAARLTALLESRRAYSVLRMGDGELNWMLAAQEGKAEAPMDQSAITGMANYIGVRSRVLPVEFYPRLLEAYTHCDYLDYFELSNPPEKLATLRLPRAANADRNPGADTSMIFYDWAFHELHGYLQRHRCLFAGGEAPLLRELLKDPRFHEAAKGHWFPDADVHFADIPGGGARYWERFEEIKAHLAKAVRETGADTLFLALSSGAKILCRELAEELQIRTFDLGSMLRALTYSATPGQQAARSSHTPFFFAVPFAAWMEATLRADPGIEPDALLARGHAQLAFDLQPKTPMGSLSFADAEAASMNPRLEDLGRFMESYRVYRKRYLPLARGNAKALRLVQEFRRWRRVRGIGLDGKLFRLLATAKRLMLRR